MTTPALDAIDTIETSRELKKASTSLALFVSDIHLSETMPETSQAFLHFLRGAATQTEQLFVLGDLFEYWAGDDDCDDPYHQEIIKALAALTHAGVQLFWIAGNRDFLVGAQFAEKTGMQRLADPSTHEIAGLKLLLSHGDILCTDDVNYMQFRQMVRQTAWQQQFLQKPLAERKAIIQGMREASMQDQRQKTMAIMDVNQPAVDALMGAHNAPILIHGHTHRTAQHQEASGIRYVLPDWDCDNAQIKRGGYLSISHSGHIQFHYIEK